jgi:hypothetical protein
MLHTLRMSSAWQVLVRSLGLGSVTILPGRVEERPGEEEVESGDCVQSRRAPPPSGAPPNRPACSSVTAASISLAGPFPLAVAEGAAQSNGMSEAEVISLRSAS